MVAPAPSQRTEAQAPQFAGSSIPLRLLDHHAPPMAPSSFDTSYGLSPRPSDIHHTTYPPLTSLISTQMTSRHPPSMPANLSYRLTYTSSAHPHSSPYSHPLPSHFGPLMDPTYTPTPYPNLTYPPNSHIHPSPSPNACHRPYYTPNS